MRGCAHPGFLPAATEQTPPLCIYCSDATLYWIDMVVKICVTICGGSSCPLFQLELYNMDGRHLIAFENR